MRQSLMTIWLLSLSAAAAAQQDSQPAAPRLGPLPATVPAPSGNPTTPAKIALGKMLFFDPRLSGNNERSCATCHLPEKAFGDGLAGSAGADGKPLSRNTQSCLNVGFLDHLFWDGRAGSLEEQALAPIQSPAEMNQPLDELEAELNAIEGYRTAFHKAFGKPPARTGIAQALAAFQRTLVTGPSPVDRYLLGDEDALSADAQAGWELFRGEAGCIKCHHGPLLSDGKFYRLGVFSQDLGRGAVTGKPQDRYRFRTPSLRNIADTAPYMHDGSLKTLDDVVTFYYRGIPRPGPTACVLISKPCAARAFRRSRCWSNSFKPYPAPRHRSHRPSCPSPPVDSCGGRLLSRRAAMPHHARKVRMVGKGIDDHFVRPLDTQLGWYSGQAMRFGVRIRLQ